MIINRYIQRNIYLGTLGALLLLVSLALFFLLVRELDDLGQGSYGFMQALEYVALSAPGKLVDFMPLAVLLGSILSLGALAGNSEVIAMQASGVSMLRMLGSVLQAALVLALLNFLIADLVVPGSEVNARKIKSLAQSQSASISSKQGLWIKDENRVVHIETLLPNGYARNLEIYRTDGQGKLISAMRAVKAVPVNDGWELHQVKQTLFDSAELRSQSFDRLSYGGNLSLELLQVLMIEPRQMSSIKLSAYLKFLGENGLDASVERLIYWQKLFVPLTIVVMCLLAFPFVLGAQRQANTGHRLLIGILLGLTFFVVDRVLTQVGNKLAIEALLIALLPNLIFLALALYLLGKKQSHRVTTRLTSSTLER